MRHTSACASLFLILGLAACGTVPPVQAPGAMTQVGIGEIPASTYTAQDVANHFIAAGVSKERLEQIRQDLLTTSENIENKKAKQLSAQSTDNVLNEIQTLSKGIEIAKDAPKIPTNLVPQAYSRSLLIQATQNISLNSLSNFEYHQRYNTYGDRLTYVDDGCSSPFGDYSAGDINFYRACDQHDFGYRNGAYWWETHTSSFKGSVDAVFNSNMLQLCREKWGSTGQNYTTCADQASVYFLGVKVVPVCIDGFNTPLCWQTNYRYGSGSTIY